MRNTLFCTAAMLLLLLASCKEKNKSIYEGCCGTEPTTASFFISIKLPDAHGNLVDSTINANVFIPNLITNDNDGENDIFLVFSGPTINKVISMDCTDNDGGLLFHRENFQPNDQSNGWNTIKADGTFYQGSFNYEVKVEFIDGQIKTYIGKACAYNCSDEGFPIDKLPNCFIPSQHDGNGGLDPSLPFYTECF